MLDDPTFAAPLMPSQAAAELEHLREGLVYGMPIDDYHRFPSLSNSGLRDFARSPLHYYASHLDPNRPPQAEQTPAQLHGQLAHCATLEPLDFTRRYTVGPEVNRNTKEWKAFAETCERAGRQPIKPQQHHAAFAQARSLRRHPGLARLFESGRSEVSAFWTDEATGVLCRCRPDWVHTTDRGVILVDVKTCSSAEPDEFARQAARMSYAHQAAHYIEGHSKAAGVEVLAFVLSAVECEWPFAASAVMFDEASLEKARRDNRELLARFAECQRTGVWPGYSEAVELISLPRWAMQADEAVAA